MDFVNNENIDGILEVDKLVECAKNIINLIGTEKTDKKTIIENENQYKEIIKNIRIYISNFESRKKTDLVSFGIKKKKKVNDQKKKKKKDDNLLNKRDNLRQEIYKRNVFLKSLIELFLNLDYKIESFLTI